METITSYLSGSCLSSQYSILSTYKVNKNASLELHVLAKRKLPPNMLAIVGASGKLGFATLTALLDHNLLSGPQIVVTTSSSSGKQKLQPLVQNHGLHLRDASYDNEDSLTAALSGCTSVLIISSPRIEKDFGPQHPKTTGRDQDVSAVLRAAKKNSATLKSVYYTSLAFANPSKSRVMKAHEATEKEVKGMGFENVVVIREGLYNESWPLYFGHYDVPGDERSEVPVAGDGKVSWTSIGDLGLANALILTDPIEKWSGRTFYLSQKKAYDLKEIAGMVSKAKGKEVRLKVMGREGHERYYVEERKMPEGLVKWWSATYDALEDGECEIDDLTLEELLARKGAKPTQLAETVQKMLES